MIDRRRVKELAAEGGGSQRAPRMSMKDEMDIACNRALEAHHRMRHEWKSDEFPEALFQELESAMQEVARAFARYDKVLDRQINRIFVCQLEEEHERDGPRKKSKRNRTSAAKAQAIIENGRRLKKLRDDLVVAYQFVLRCREQGLSPNVVARKSGVNSIDCG